MRMNETARSSAWMLLLGWLAACGNSGEAVGEHQAELGAEQSLWPSSVVPAQPSVADGAAVELGVKFKAASAGQITGIRFYKGAGNGGTHTGSLWSSTGTRLATTTFTQETASGWQVARFATPVTIQAQTVYVASYFAPLGQYAGDNGYFGSARISGALTAPSSVEAGGNGVFRYGSPGGFPSSSWESSNYYVDVLFAPEDAPTGTGGGDGLKGEYFDNADLTALKETRIDPRVSFNFGRGSPFPTIGANSFSVRWTGELLAPVTGSYRLSTTSDDGVRLWVNGQQLVNNWTNHSATTNTGTIALTAGQRYAIKLEYFEQSGDAQIQLAWTVPGGARTVIPQSQLFSGATTQEPPPNPSDTTAPSAPTALSATATGSSSIDLSWAAASDNVAVTRYLVFRGAAQVGTVNAPTVRFTETGLTASTAYSYSVKASDAAGNIGAASSTASATTLAAPPPGSDPLASLPRVPWEGGPAYYRQFPTLANTEWTTPGFFPVMYWGAYVNEPDKAFNNAALGINVYGETYAPVAGWQQNARNAGIWEIGHMLPDEADMWAGYGNGTWSGKWGFQPGVCLPEGTGCSPDMFRKLEAQRDPNDGLMRYYNGGKGMLMWMQPETGAKFVNGETWPVSIATGDSTLR